MEQRTVGGTGNVPTPSTDLVGRELVVGEVADLARGHRLVTLTGVGGVGKTRVALGVATALAGEQPDGAWVVELASLTDAASVPDAIATVLGITPQAGVAAVDTLADGLSGRRCLLVLDNCEHLVAAVASVVRELLDRAPGIHILATSREALDLPGEQRRLVLPLSRDGGVDSPAVALFVARARERQSRVDFADESTALAVLEVCDALDGLPLGIELAAARTVSMSPIDLRDRLGDLFRLLVAAPHVPRRQQTLRAMVAWSDELLDDDERTVLRQAGVFQGGFDVHELAGALGAADELPVLDALDSLVRKSLVAVEDVAGRTRYSLLETIRQFAEEELASTGRLDDARDRHAAVMADAASERWSEWNGPGWRRSVDWLSAELPNLRVAFRWSRSRGRLDVATDIAAHAGLMGASVQLFEPVGWAVELLDDVAGAALPRLPRLYTAAAWSCFTGRAGAAVRDAEAALRLEGDPSSDPCEPGLAGLVEALANVYDGHLDRYVEAATRVAALGGRARGWGLSLLLDGLQASGRVDEALAMTGAAMAEARALGNPYFVAYAYWTGGGAWSTTDPTRALEIWREGLDFVQRERVDFFTGFIARDAARLRLLDADPDDALAMFDAAIDSFHQAGNVAQLTITLASATALLERTGPAEAAATLHGAVSRQPGSDHHVPELVELAERVRAGMGDDAFRVATEAGAAMHLGDAAHFARRAIAQTRATTAQRRERPGGLSAREVDVLRLAAAGLTTKEIAEQLFISAKTADRHIQNIYTKIGTSNRAAATRWAFEHDLVS